jgi:hypothetical protein
VVKAEGVWGVVYKVEGVLRVWLGRGRAEPGFVPTYIGEWCISRSDGGGVRGLTQRISISLGGDQFGLKLGAGWVEVALARRQTMEWPHLDDTAKTEVGVVEDPPDQVHAVESG